MKVFPRTAVRWFALALVGAFLAAPPAAAQTFSKLFTTAQEREYLDYLRDEFLAANAEEGFNVDENAPLPVVPEEEEEAPPEIVHYHLGGILTRLDGSRAVWLNGALLNENELPANASLAGGDRSALLAIRYQGNEFLLKPGQTVNVVTGEVSDAYQNAGSVP